MKVILKEIVKHKNNAAKSGINNYGIGQEVIVRTSMAGSWFGRLKEKSGDEVILTDARRMWQWWAKKSISLSGVALYGIKHDKSRIAGAVDSVWLQAIEIIPVSGDVAESIRLAPEAEQDE